MYRRGIVFFVLLFLLYATIVFGRSVVKSFRYKDLPTEVALNFEISGSGIDYSTEMNVAGDQLKLFLYDCSFPTAPRYYRINITPVDFVEFYAYVSGSKRELITTVHLTDRTIYGVKVKQISKSEYSLDLSLKKNVKLIDINFTGNRQSTLSLAAKLLAEEMGRNIIVDPKVGDRIINIKLTNVTFQEALNNLTLAADVSYIKLKDGSIYISDPATIEEKFREEAGSNIVKVYDLSYFRQRNIDLSSVTSVLKDLVENRGFIQLLTGSNMLVVRGDMSVQNAVSSILSRMKAENIANAQYKVRYITLDEAEQLVNVTYPSVTVKKLSSIGILLLKGSKSDVSAAVQLLSELDVPKRPPTAVSPPATYISKANLRPPSGEIENKIISLPASASTSVRAVLNLFLPDLSTMYIKTLGILALRGSASNIKTAISLIDMLRNLKPAKSAPEERLTYVYPLGSLKYETAYDIVKGLYPTVDIVNIPEKNEVLLKGERSVVNQAVSMLDSVRGKPTKLEHFTVSASPDIITPVSSMITFFYPKAKVRVNSKLGIIGIECPESEVEGIKNDIADWKNSIRTRIKKPSEKAETIRVYMLSKANNSILASVITSMYPSAKVALLPNGLVIMASSDIQEEISQLISEIDMHSPGTVTTANATVITQMKLMHDSGDRIVKTLKALDIGVEAVYDEKTKTLFFKGTSERIKIAETIANKLDVYTPKSVPVEKHEEPQSYIEELTLSNANVKAVKALIEFLYPDVKAFASEKWNMLLVKGPKSTVESVKKDVERWDKQIRVFTAKASPTPISSKTHLHTEQLTVRINEEDTKAIKSALEFLHPDVKVELYPTLNLALLKSSDATSLQEAKKMIMAFNPPSTIATIVSSPTEIATTFTSYIFLSNLNLEDAKRLVQFYYPSVKTDEIPSLKLLTLKGKKIDVTNATKDLRYFDNMAYQMLEKPSSTVVSTPSVVSTITFTPMKSSFEKGIQVKGNELSIDVSDANVRDVILYVAKLMGKNCLVDANVMDTITIVVKGISFDSFIDILKDAYDYDVKNVGSTYIIKAKSKTNKVRAIYDIKYNLDNLKEVLKFFDVKVYVDKAMNLLIIEGNEKTIEDANDIVRQLDKPPKQVMIETKILDTDLTNDYMKRVMLSWTKNTKGIQLNPFGKGGDYIFTTTADKFLGNLNISADLKEVLSNSRILSQPSLTTLNGQQATILLGDKVPYQTRDKNGNVVVNFLSIGIQLQITPYVNSKGEILLNLYTKVSNVSGYSENIPIESTREARTNVLISNGSTIVIGGLIKNTKTDTVTKIPFFSMLPVIGELFQSHSEQMEEHELTIFVTAKVVGFR